MKTNLIGSLKIGESLTIGSSNLFQNIKNKNQVLIKFKNGKVFKMSLQCIFDKKYFIFKFI